MQFGTLTNGSYVIPAYWQSLWNALAQVATMLGATIAGPVQDLLGRRASFLLGAMVSAAGIAVVYTASTPGVFLAGKFVNGLALGICLTTGQTYLSEVAPLPLRGIALSSYTFCMVSNSSGQLINGCLPQTESWIYDRGLSGTSSPFHGIFGSIQSTMISVLLSHSLGDLFFQ